MKGPLSGFKNGFMEKKMATHSSILAWKSPWTEEPGRLQSMGLHDWACVHECDGRWVGSNKLVELKKKKKNGFSFLTYWSVSSVAQSSPTLCHPVDCSTPGFPVHLQFPELGQTCVHQVSDASNHLILCHPPPPAFSLSQHQGLFQWVGSSHQVAKVLELQLQHQSFQWIFRTEFLPIDWLDLLAVQGTLKSFLQHHSSKASILWHSTFFMVPLSHPNMTTEKIIALTRRTFVSQVMSLLFNMLSTLVIAFLPRSKHLLISWLSSPSAVLLEPKKVKSVTVSIVSPSVCHEVMYVNCELPDVQARFRRGRGNYWYYI